MGQSRARLKIAILAAALCSALITSPAQAAIHPHGQMTANAAPGTPSCADGASPEIVSNVVALPSPPPGFNPLGASDAERAKYGFPPRPAHGTANEAAWAKLMSGWKQGGNKGPAWTCGERFGPGSSWSSPSDHEAGNYDYAKDQQQPYYLGAHGTFEIPVVYPTAISRSAR